MLNIGAGQNLSGAMRPLRAKAGHLVGVDPDSTIELNTAVDERHQLSMEEYARTSPEAFDCAVAVFVLEHVSDAPEFLAAVAAVLRPGASFYALTVNKYQYFGLCTLVATRLGVGDWLLERLIGAERMSGYHFPTEYRLNSVGQVSRRLREAGFTSAEFRCFDKTEMYDWYLPERVRSFAPAYTRFVYRWGSPYLMGNLAFRAIRR